MSCKRREREDTHEWRTWHTQRVTSFVIAFSSLRSLFNVDLGETEDEKGQLMCIGNTVSRLNIIGDEWISRKRLFVIEFCFQFKFNSISAKIWMTICREAWNECVWEPRGTGHNRTNLVCSYILPNTKNTRFSQTKLSFGFMKEDEETREKVRQNQRKERSYRAKYPWTKQLFFARKSRCFLNN
jgi:hypothetical protein